MNKLPESLNLTQKQETFAQGFVDGMSQSDAYKQAYEAGNMLPAAISNNAYKLMQNNDIATRILELRDSVTAGKAWSFQHGMEEVETNITQASELNQMSAAIRGTEQALKLSGLLTERPPDTVAITKVTVILSSRDGKKMVVDGTSRMLPDTDEAR